MAISSSKLALFTCLSVSALVALPSAGAIVCTIFPFLPICGTPPVPPILPPARPAICVILPLLSICQSPPPPIFAVSPPPPPPPAGSTGICVIFPFLSICQSPPPPIFSLPPPPPPPPPPTSDVPLTATFITGILACPINTQLPRLTLLTNALVDLRCGIGSPTTFSLATTATDGAGNYFISLDVAASTRFNPNTCALVITAQANVCFPTTQLNNVPLRVVAVSGGVVLVTSTLYG